MIVVDASVVVGALLGSEKNVMARLSREPVLHAPELLSLECASVLRRLILAGQLGERIARSALGRLTVLPLALHPHLDLLSRIWELRANVTVYDATYVALAEALDMALVTSDARLARTPGLRCRVELL